MKAEHGEASLIDAFARGELPDDRAAALLRHVAACDPCGEAFRRVVTGESPPRRARLVEVGRTRPSGADGYQLEAALEPLDGGARFFARHRGLGWRVMLWRPGGDPEPALERAKSAAQLAHPSLAQVLDFGLDGKGAFVALEPADGEPLGERLRRGAPSLELVEQAVDLVRHLHLRGRVHGRLEPARFVVDRDDALRLIDPGLSPPRAPLLDPRWAAPERDPGRPPAPSEDVYFAARLASALSPEARLLVESATADDASDRLSIIAFDERLRRLRRDGGRGWDLDESPLAFAVFDPSGRLTRGNRAFRRRADREHGLARFFGELAVTRRNPWLKVLFAEVVACGRTRRSVLPASEGRALVVLAPRAHAGCVEAVHLAWVDA